jgi:toxin CptA
MHNAPSVTYPVGRSLLCAALLAALWTLAALLVAWWCQTVAAIGWRQWLALLALPAAAAGAWLSLRAMGIGELRWDGQVWLWHPRGAQEAMTVLLGVHLDLQRHLLVLLRPEHGLAVWCWASRKSYPERWGDLRRAVYSPATSRAAKAMSDDASVPP